ncbi:MAG: endonuclease/exonuclease/phosphatase family protein [Methylococcales bacterium]|nr:endonuclease/exonuclease/phosphatase family protein [Methylococcales bacterium]
MSVLASACVNSGSLSTLRVTNSSATIATNVGDCRALLGRTVHEPQDQLDPGSISLLNWNIKKGTGNLWQGDLRVMTIGKELVVLQEAVLGPSMDSRVDEVNYASFSQGFTTKSRASGVVTYSSIKPLSECHFAVIEPFLGTRKATGVTEFGLAGVDETLVVVNIHGINFSLGLTRFREQMEQVREVLGAHSGPAILLGDFNTWRRKRLEIVGELATDLNFSAVLFDEDHRTTFNGYALDHVFFRGLSVVSSESKLLDSSDHNPLSVEFRL